MNLSIRGRLNGSFSILVAVFVLNGIMTVVTLHTSKKLSDYISTVIDPAQQERDDFEDILVQSKMYSTNWVFLRSDQEDKDALNDLQSFKYPNLKSKLNSFYVQLHDKKMADSLNKIFMDFEELISIEKKMMLSLHTFTDYDDPVKKMQAEQIIEDEVIPRTSQLMVKLSRVAVYEREAKLKEFNLWETYSNRLRVFITLLTICLTILAFILSKYFTSIITDPINKIRHIINDLGKGVTRKINDDVKKDEIGDMILSVNRLSEKLEETAIFAEETGKRNFSISYSPLSDEDTLGKALVMMRKNLQTSEEKLTQTASYLIQRNTDLEQFSYIISHNLRAPVANIIGLTEALEIPGLPEESNRMLIKNISISVQKLDHVIMDITGILELRQGIKEQKEMVKFSSLLDDIKLSIDNTIRSEEVIIKSDFSAIDEMTTIKSYIYSVFINLISNSIKYRQLAIQPVIEIISRKLNGKTQIIFSDNGLGIDLQKKGGNVFGLYKRFHGHVEGKGMGLYMVKTQVESLGGTISIDSAVNKGTRFTIEFDAK